jgi:hypothetical protein
VDYVRGARLDLGPIEKMELGLVGGVECLSGLEVLGFGILQSKAGLICFKYPI